MAFSFFGRKPQDPDAAPTSLEELKAEEAAPEPPQRKGIFDRMRQAVTRTRETFSESIGTVVALTREVDESTLASLEPLLLAADVGSATTAIVLEASVSAPSATASQAAPSSRRSSSTSSSRPRRRRPPHRTTRATRPKSS